MTDEPAERLRIAPYSIVSASELAQQVVASKGNQARTAAISTAVNVPRQLHRERYGWQERVMHMDENGPGFVGWMLDAKALIASLVPAVTQERQPDGTWARCDDEVVQAATQLIANDEADTPELVSEWYRSLDSVGERWCWFAESDDKPSIQLRTASVNQLVWSRQGDQRFAAILTDPSQTKDSPDVEWVPAELMMRSWVKNKRWPALAHSSYRRALPDIERYVATRRSIVRVLNSRLVTNGIVNFHVTPGERQINPNTPGANQSNVPMKVQDFMQASLRAMRDDLDPAGNAPFVTWGEKAPEWVEVGRFLDQNALAAEVAALEAIGRAVNFPLQLLLQGPGAGNHWSDIFLNETFLMQDVASTLSATYRDITKGPYRRVLKGMFDKYDIQDDPRHYRLWYDLSEIAKRPDDTAEVLDMWAAGLISAPAARARLGISEAEAPAAGELPTRNVISNRVSTNTMPSAPKTKYAALTVGSADVTDLAPVTDELNAIDQQLFDDLDGIAQSTIASIVIEAGRRALATLPPGDPLRSVLASLPEEQVWSAVPPHIRSQVDITSISGDLIPPAQANVEHRLHAAAIAILAVFAHAGIGAPRNLPGLVAAGVAMFVAGIALAAANRLRNPPIESPPRWAPTSVARDSMRSATGAVATRDPDGLPQLPDGTWQGGDGPATGPYSAAALLVAAPELGLLYTWVHDDPPRPFEPHLMLNGVTWTDRTMKKVLANPNEFPGPIFFAGDHAGCRCMKKVSLALLPAGA